MINLLRKKLRARQERKDLLDKTRLCAPCDEPCGKDLCRRVGCLNMDMRTNSLRLQLLVNRVDDAQEQLRRQKIVVNSVYGPFVPKRTPQKNNIIDLNDYRK